MADLFCLKQRTTGTQSLEVHVLDGSSAFQSFLLQTGTPIGEADAANFVFAVADFNGDGIADLFCLKRANTGTGSLEVHILDGSSNYQNFLLQTGTPIGEADAAANFVFAVGDYNGDGVPDLFCLKRTSTGTGTLEVHVLDGSSSFQSFTFQGGSALPESDAAPNFVFAVGDFEGCGLRDVFCLKRFNCDSRSLEVHVLKARS
jgi:hypothetical protein